MSIGNFFLKQLVKSKMKDVPAAEQDKILELFEKNPDFFQKLAEKVQSKVKNGQDQHSAIMEAVSENKEELTKVFGKGPVQ